MSYALNAVSQEDIDLFNAWRQTMASECKDPEEVQDFIEDLKLFDWWYDYTDDSSAWRAGKAREEHLKKKGEELAKVHPELLPLMAAWRKTGVFGECLSTFDSFKRSEVTRKANENPHVRAMMDGFSPMVINAYKKTIIQLIKLVISLPEDERYRFVMTPATPSQKLLREAIRPASWYGTTIPEHLQLKVREFFTENASALREALEFNSKYGFRYVRSDGVSKVAVAYLTATDEPGFASARYVHLYGGNLNRNYRFFV